MIRTAQCNIRISFKPGNTPERDREERAHSTGQLRRLQCNRCCMHHASMSAYETQFGRNPRNALNLRTITAALWRVRPLADCRLGSETRNALNLRTITAALWRVQPLADGRLGSDSRDIGTELRKLFPHALQPLRPRRQQDIDTISIEVCVSILPIVGHRDGIARF
jgi:hypothetical protein